MGSFLCDPKEKVTIPTSQYVDRLYALFHILLWSSCIDTEGSVHACSALCLWLPAPETGAPPQGHSRGVGGGAFHGSELLVVPMMALPLQALPGTAAGKLPLCCGLLGCHLRATLALPFQADISWQQLQSRYVHLVPYCIQASSQSWWSGIALTLTESTLGNTLGSSYWYRSCVPSSRASFSCTWISYSISSLVSFSLLNPQCSKYALAPWVKQESAQISLTVGKQNYSCNYFLAHSQKYKNKFGYQQDK